MLMAINSLTEVQTKTIIKTAKQRTQFQLQRNTYRRKRNYSPYLFGCIIHIRTRFTKQRWWIFFPRTKIQHTDKINAHLKWTSTCIMQHNREYHGIIHGSRNGRIIWKLLTIDSHENDHIINGISATPNTGGNGQYSGKQYCKCNGKTKNI